MVIDHRNVDADTPYDSAPFQANKEGIIVAGWIGMRSATGMSRSISRVLTPRLTYSRCCESWLFAWETLTTLMKSEWSGRPEIRRAGRRIGDGVGVKCRVLTRGDLSASTADLRAR
jgi:hypothetical protein